MKSFLIYLLIITLLFVLSNMALGKVVDTALVSGGHTYFEEWDQIVNGEINADVIILGSSRGKVSYDPRVFENKLNTDVFNLSFDAGPYNLQIDKFNTYLAYNKRPKILIQNIDLAHFSTLSKIPFREQLLPVTRKSEIREIFKKYEATFSFWELSGVVKYAYDPRLYKRAISYVFNSGKSDASTVDLKGFYPVDKQFQEDVLNLKRLQELGDTGTNLVLKDNLKKTLSFLKNQAESGTRVILSWIPEHSKRRVLTLQTSQEIKNELIAFSNNVANVDFIDLQSYPLEEANFYDTFHLNSEGSLIVSNVIANRILKLKK